MTREGNPSESEREEGLSRRELFGGAGALALGGCAAQGVSSGSEPEPGEAFRELGVRPVINGFGVHNGGSVVSPRVARAMRSAAGAYVLADELAEGAGRRLAELCGAEWGLVTSGATGALCAATCAAVAGTDPDAMARLPDTRGLPSEVIVPHGHRHPYDRAFRMVGCRLVEVASPAELAASFSGRTAMVALLGAALDRGPLGLEFLVREARGAGVPVLVDAASEGPTSPDRYLAAGVDLVAYSAGKCLRGPESAGYLLGSEALVRAAGAHVSPNVEFGRVMKVGKEEVVGAVVALEEWFEGRDVEAERLEAERKLRVIERALATVPGVVARLATAPPRMEVGPRLTILWDDELVPRTAEDVRGALLAGVPRIDLPTRGGGVFVLAQLLEQGEEVLVARRLRDVLSEADGPREA